MCDFNLAAYHDADAAQRVSDGHGDLALLITLYKRAKTIHQRVQIFRRDAPEQRGVL